MIKYIMFVHGGIYEFELTDLFPDHTMALDTALGYRFDLKE